jgi:D-arginine dehydrogenase
MNERVDILVVGAGMAGASLAAELAGEASVLLVEAEEQPGYHSTGRSAAFWSETYGGPAIQPLTSASGPFLQTKGFLRPRGAIHVAEDEEGREAITRLASEFGDAVRLETLDGESLAGRIPGLRQRWRWGLAEPTCSYIDVDALHVHYLREA